MRTRNIAFLALIVFGLIQLMRSPRNVDLGANANDIALVYPVPPDVQVILKKACYDCHSNSTQYPWYSNLQPFGWWIQHHVDVGKQALNFSEFGSYQSDDHSIIFREMDDVLSMRTMPLASYQLLHPEAQLSDEHVRRLREWIHSLRESIPKDR